MTMKSGMMTHWTSYGAVADAAGLPDQEAMEIGQHLFSENLCKFETMGGRDGSLSITTQGIARAEQLLTARSARLSDDELRRNVEVIVMVLVVEVEKASALSEDDRRNISSDLRSVQDQLMAPTPNRGIIRSGLQRIKQMWPTVMEISTVASNLATVFRGW